MTLRKVPPSDRVLRSSKNGTQAQSDLSSYSVRSVPKVSKSYRIRRQPKKPDPERRSKLTVKRKKKITSFLEKTKKKPWKKIGTFGSSTWIKSLIAHMREPKHMAPTVDDVQKWMNSTNFFEDTIKKILTTIKRQLPPAIANVSDSGSDLFDCDMGMEDSYSSTSSTGSKVEDGSGLTFSEPIRGKTGWFSVSYNHKENHNDEDSEMEIETKIFDNESMSHTMDGKIDRNCGKMRQDFPHKILKPSTRSITERRKEVITIFPSGFEWKGSVGRNAKMQEATSVVVPELSSGAKLQLKMIPKVVLEKIQVKSSRVAVISPAVGNPSETGNSTDEHSSENGQETGHFSGTETSFSVDNSHDADTLSVERPSGTFVVSIPLRGNSSPSYPEGTLFPLPIPEGKPEREATGEQAASSHVIEPTTKIASFSSAEEILTYLVNNGNVVLHHWNQQLDEASIPTSALNDISMTQIYTNKIIEIANRNKAEQSTHINWKGVACCCSILNLILQGEM